MPGVGRTGFSRIVGQHAMCNIDESVVYYFRSPQEIADQDFVVLGAGRYRSPKDSIYPPMGHPPLYNFRWRSGRVLPEFHAVLISEGAGEVEFVQGEVTLFEAPAIILICPGVWHRYRPASNRGWTERWISYSGTFAYWHFDAASANGALISLRTSDAGRLVNEFDDFIESINRFGAMPLPEISLRALRMVSVMAGLKWHSQAVANDVHWESTAHSFKDDPIIRKALEIIWSAGHPLCSVRDIVRQLSVSRRTLDQKFRIACGHTILDEINICRRSRAKRLLGSTDLPIKTVAHLAGYSSPEQMRVSFVQNEKMPPVAYRQNKAV